MSAGSLLRRAYFSAKIQIIPLARSLARFPHLWQNGKLISNLVSTLESAFVLSSCVRDGLPNSGRKVERGADRPSPIPTPTRRSPIGRSAWGVMKYREVLDVFGGLRARAGGMGGPVDRGGKNGRQSEQATQI